MLKTVRQTRYQTSDGKLFDDKAAATEHERFTKLHEFVADRLNRHYDAEEVCRALLSTDSPFLIVFKS
jgi:hypothetical protein